MVSLPTGSIWPTTEDVSVDESVTTPFCADADIDVDNEMVERDVGERGSTSTEENLKLAWMLSLPVEVF